MTAPINGTFHLEGTDFSLAGISTPARTSLRAGRHGRAHRASERGLLTRWILSARAGLTKERLAQAPSFSQSRAAGLA